MPESTLALIAPAFGRVHGGIAKIIIKRGSQGDSYSGGDLFRAKRQTSPVSPTPCACPDDLKCQSLFLLRSRLPTLSPHLLHAMFPAVEDAIRCHGSLLKLSRHLEGPVVITGGVAIGWHLLNNGVRRVKGRLNDIDVVVTGLTNLRASLRQEFLIRHFHPFRERGKILIMLVDEEYRTRIDVFTPGTDSLIRRLTDLQMDELALKLISAEDLLAKLLSILYPITQGKQVNPKYFEHFQLLSLMADPEKAREVWCEYRKENQPEFEEAAKDVERSVRANPALLSESSYSQDINEACSWCHESELFPLATLSRIQEILGYV